MLILVSPNAGAQDFHFSQFVENPSVVNPALTGVAGPLRASLTYREQWRSAVSPYKTYGVGFDTRLKNGNWEQVDKFRGMTFKERSIGRLAWGFSAYSDKAGTADLGLTRGSFNLASFVPLSNNSFISLGIQAAVVQRRGQNGNLIFPNQYSGGMYDPNISSGEKFSTLYYVYPDLAAGLLWSYKQKQNRIAHNSLFKANVGFAASHLTKPKQTFLQTKQSLAMRYTVHGDLVYEPGFPNVAFQPLFLFQWQAQATELIAGLQVKYFFKDNSHYTGIVKRSAFGLGVSGRNKDAMICTALLDIKEQCLVGISYDINLSAFGPSTRGRGAMEINIRVTPPAGYLYEKRPVTNGD